MKKFLSVLLVLLILLSFAACGTTPPAATNTPAASTAAAATSEAAQPAGWSVAVEGASKTAFTQADYAALTEVTIEATKKKKDGSEEKIQYTGVLISDAIKALGAESFTKITLTASDGFAADITPDMLSDKAIFAVKEGGKDLESGEVPTSVLEGQASKTWVKGFVKITITK